MKKNGFIKFLYQLPPRLVILAGTALFFAAGFALGSLFSSGNTDLTLSIASVCALVPGYGGSVLFLMKKD